MNTTAEQRRRGFSVVFAIELWERFGFYGMQAVLTVFLVQQLGFSDHRVNSLLGASSALAYIMPILGGIAGDRIVGTRVAMLLGAAGLTSGYLCLSLIPQSITGLFCALSLIAVGNGLFKPNAGNLVRKIYADDKTKLDTVFTLYYMSVNIGSMVSMLLTPWLHTNYGPNVAFGACVVGLIIGLLYYSLRSKWLNSVIKNDKTNMIKNFKKSYFAIGIFLSLIFCYLIIQNEFLAEWGILFSILGIIYLWIRTYKKSKAHEHASLIKGYSLSVFAAVYYAYYQQSITSLTLYTMRDVSGDFNIFGKAIFHFSPGQFQSLNSFWIFLLSPALAWLYQSLGRAEREPSIGQKMLLGYAVLTCAFFLWWFTSLTASTSVSPWVMVAGYGLMSLSELLTGGLGLAVVARYVPDRFGGVMNGSVYALWGVAMYAGSLMANAVEYIPGNGGGANVYAPLFKNLTFLALSILLFGSIMYYLTSRIAKRYS
ncbi:MFS transporter [Neokomagataea tanensis]|uniref:MFS transporter n=2 Tax=Neokomagataea TaxID=1223423 RepID=A0A4Y6VC79_9PROT|nr:oligopeptide:H+ symporter [Neokomagataea tanensis]QDH25995.1 MFS transporter [Neokomagataea tanensis]